MNKKWVLWLLVYIPVLFIAWQIMEYKSASMTNVLNISKWNSDYARISGGCTQGYEPVYPNREQINDIIDELSTIYVTKGLIRQAYGGGSYSLSFSDQAKQSLSLSGPTRLMLNNWPYIISDKDYETIHDMLESYFVD